MIKANYNLMSVSKLFTIFHKAECLENALSEKPQLAIGNLLIECGFEDMLQSAMTNIAACFLVWWKTKTRTVWRVSSETANYIKKVNLSFLPEIPPKSWNGNALLIESKAFDNPFIHDIFSLACYRIPDMQGIERYFFVCLQYPDGIFAFSITTNLFKINKKMAESGELFAPGFMIDNEYVDLQGVPPDEMREVAFDIIKFIFAFSYYIDSPKIEIEHTFPGPRPKPVKGKKKLKNKKSLWNYSVVKISSDIENATNSKEVRALDKSNLSLEPVLVSPHIRRHGDKIIIIDQYDSSRWKSQEKIGNKKII